MEGHSIDQINPSHQNSCVGDDSVVGDEGIRSSEYHNCTVSCVGDGVPNNGRGLTSHADSVGPLVGVVSSSITLSLLCARSRGKS